MMKLKRGIALLLCVCMIFGILPAVHAEDLQEEQETVALEEVPDSSEEAEEEVEEHGEVAKEENSDADAQTEVEGDEAPEEAAEDEQDDSESQLLMVEEEPDEGYYDWMENIPIESSDRYTGNQGDSFISAIGTRNGKKDIYGTTFEHGLEVWIARWNFTEELSWAWTTYRLNGMYKVLSGTLSILAGSYNKADFDTTLEIIGDDVILFSANLTPNMEPIPIHLDLSGIEVLKISAYDNRKVRGGTSFALGDLRLAQDETFEPPVDREDDLQSDEIWLDEIPIDSHSKGVLWNMDSKISALEQKAEDVNGISYIHGVEAFLNRAPSMLKSEGSVWATYNLGGKYKTLSGTISILEKSENKSDFNITLKILGDNDIILFSAILTPETTIIPVEVDVSKVVSLTLSVYDNYSAYRPTSVLLGNCKLVRNSDQVFPDGYNFYDDSYSFENYATEIPIEYYRAVYGTEECIAEALYRVYKEASLGGVCFGMAYTTASIYNSYPDCSNIVNKAFLSDKNCQNIREIIGGNSESSLSVLSVGNNKMTINEYIEKAFLYQFSKSYAQNRVFVSGSEIIWLLDKGEKKKASDDIEKEIGILEFFDYVKNKIDNDNVCVVISLYYPKWDSNGEQVIENGTSKFNGHAILAVGYDENGIFCDDPNKTDSWRYLRINSDGTWSYTGDKQTDDKMINEKTSFFTYSVDYNVPFLALKAGAHAVVKPEIEKDENFIKEPLDVNDGSIFIYIKSIWHKLLNNMKYTPAKYTVSTNGSFNNDDGDIYWVDKNSPIEIDGFSDDNAEIIIANDGRILTLQADKMESLSAQVENGQVQADVQAEDGSGISIGLEFYNEKNKTSIIISDAVVNGEITVEATEDNSIVMKGLSSGKIQLVVDEEIVNEKNFADAAEELNISFDQSGETDTLVISNEQEQPHEHVYDQEIATEKFIMAEASCTAPATYYKSCVCGEAGTETFTSGNPLGHTEVIDKAVEADCTIPGKTEGKHCSVCGTVIVAQETVLAKGHTSSAWEQNENSHWQICERCGEEIEGTRGAHLDENGDKLCDICGRSVAAEHKHSFHWNGYNKDKNGHTVRCDCGESHVEAHSRNLAGRCKVCGYAVGGVAKAAETITNAVSTLIRKIINPLGR